MRNRRSLSSSAFYKIIFVLSLFMLFFVSSISYKQMELLNSSEKLVRLSDRVNLELEQLLSFVKDAETGQRGFIITHDSLYLQPYMDAQIHIKESFRELNYLTKDSRIQQTNLKLLTDLVTQRFEIFALSLREVRSDGTVSDVLKQQLKISRNIMFRIRSQTDKMIATEAKLLKERNSAHKANVFLTPLSALLTSVFSLIVFIASFLKINSDQKKMTALAQQATHAKIVHESERVYRELIEGLPTALYTCDQEGYIRIYNQAASELWGREPEIGKDKWSGAFRSYKVDGSDLSSEECAVVSVLNQQSTGVAEIIIERPNGEKRHVISHPRPIVDTKGEITGAVNMLLDVTGQKLSQKALQESEVRLRIATESAQLATWDLDLLSREIVYAPRLNEIFGHPADHVMTHQQMRDQLHPEDCVKIVEKAFEHALETGDYSYEARVVWPDGTLRWIKTDGKVIFHPEDGPSRMLGTMFDITEQKETQERILQSEKLFRSIALNIPKSLITVIDKDYRIVMLEGDILEKMGYESSNYTGESIESITPPENREELLPLYQKVMTGDTFSIERKAETGDLYMLHFIPLKTDNGETYAGLIIALDISDYKKNQQKIAMLGAIVESSDDAIVSKTLDGIITSWNKAATRIFGWKEEEMLGQSITKIIPSDRLDEGPRILEQIKQGNRVDHFETKRIAKDGKILDISLSLSPVKDENGNIIGASKIARDITAHKLAERRIIESEERFRTLIDAAPVLVWMSGLDKHYYFFNKSWLDFTGRTLEQESGDGWKASVHPEDVEGCVTTYSNAFDLKEGFYMEYRLRRYDGEYRWISDKGIPRFSSDGSFMGYIGGGMDIHQQKSFAAELERQVRERTEELNRSNVDLREQKEFAETILDTSIDITLVYDRDMRFLSFNKAAEKKYGVTKDEILGQELLEFYPQSKDSKGHQDLSRALNGEHIHNSRYKSPITNLYYEDFLIPLKKGKGEVYAVLVIARDITETIENEELLLHLNESLISKNAELERSNTELASFNHVASHDLQEPLRKIQTFISRIAEKDAENLSEKGVEYFAKIQSSANRMQKLIDDLLTFSRTNKADQQHESVDLNALVEIVQKELAQTIEEKDAVIVCDKLPVLHGIAFQFQQLFINLIGNALKYSRPDVQPMIQIQSETVTAGEYGFLKGPADKQYYKLTVSDNGIGFDPQYSLQIFDLFQRLHGKTEYTGTGIGLTICKKIIENHHGFIVAEGKPGKGALFTFFLPV